jgi:hypothetical protein
MKRAAAAPAGGVNDIAKRFKEALERSDAEGEARVAAFFARMPAALAALDAASADRVVLQLRAELLQTGSEAPDDADDAVHRDFVAAAGLLVAVRACQGAQRRLLLVAAD